MKKLGDIFKLACKEKSTVTIPIRIKNGSISKEDKGLFELLQYAGESENMFTIIEVTDAKISIEICKEGVCNIVNEMIKMESDIYQD